MRLVDFHHAVRAATQREVLVNEAGGG